MISLDRKQLMAALESVKAMAESKSTLPILSHVDVHAEGGVLRLACTDLHTGASVSVPYQGVGGFRLTADVRAMLDRCKRFTNGHAELGATPAPKRADGSEGDPKLTLAEGSRVYELRGGPSDDFPPLPTRVGAWNLFTIAASDLASAMDRVLYAASSDETRPHINAVRLEVSCERLRLVTTDGHRLALHDAGITTGVRWIEDSEAPSLDFLVSIDSAEKIRALLTPSKVKGAGSALASLSTDGRNLFVEVRGVEIVARLVDAQFPRYTQVMPSTGSMARHVTCDAAALLDALRAVECCTPKRTGGVRITMEASRVVLFAEDFETGTATETVPAGYFTPAGELEPFRYHLNLSYLREALQAGDSGKATIYTNGALDPMLVGCAPGTIAVVMPMRM
jgi:DNA polymerase-3 subunit beta